MQSFNTAALKLKEVLFSLSLVIILHTGVSTSILRGSHIVGGEITYKFVQRQNNKIQYHFTLKVYRDLYRSNANSILDANAAIAIYLSTNNGNKIYGDNDNKRIIYVPLKSKSNINSPSIPCLTPPSDIGVEEGIYEWDATLQDTTFSYFVTYQRCCRNNTIKNIYNAGDSGSTYTVEITADAQHLNNSSPAFSSFPPIFICNGEQLKFDHSASDTEGDQLVYKLCAPLLGGSRSNPAPIPPTGPPYSTVVFIQPDYSIEKPMGGNPPITINANTGMISGIPNVLDQFVVSVCVEEYRNGKLIGKIFRDFQFNVVNCKRTVVSSVLADSSSVSISGSTGAVRKDYFVYGCENITLTLNNTSYDRSQINDFYWEFDNKGKIERYRDWSPTITFKDTGLYTGKLLLNPGLPCGDSAFVKIQLGGHIQTDIQFQYDTCVAGPVAFQGKAISAYPIKQIFWHYGEGKSDSNRLSTTHQFETPGLKRVLLSAKDKYGCGGDTSISFNWQPAPPILIVEPNNFVGCAPGKVFFNNRSKPIDTTYSIKWDFGDGTFGSNISPTHIYEKPDTYSVHLTIISPIGCKKEAHFNKWIKIKPTPEADFDWSPKIVNNTSKNLVYFDDISQSVVAWQWFIGKYGYSTKRFPTFSFKDTGYHTIKLFVRNTEGCVDSVTKSLYVEPFISFFMPNAFSPNYDTVNDEFRGAGSTFGMKSFQLTVWNRWGEQIFQTQKTDEGWNGQKNNVGDPAPQGIYMYELIYVNHKNEKISKRDYITLFR